MTGSRRDFDAAMTTGQARYRRHGARPAGGGRAPVIEFRDVRLFDPDGAPRAAFPAVRVHLDAGPILSGQSAPTRGYRGRGPAPVARRGGRFDLDLAGAQGSAT
jgi:hypothetical protein